MEVSITNKKKNKTGLIITSHVIKIYFTEEFFADAMRYAKVNIIT